MDETLVLQTAGRLYLENLQLQKLLSTLPDKDAEIAHLRQALEDELSGKE